MDHGCAAAPADAGMAELSTSWLPASAIPRQDRRLAIIPFGWVRAAPSAACCRPADSRGGHSS